MFAPSKSVLFLSTYFVIGRYIEETTNYKYMIHIEDTATKRPCLLVCILIASDYQGTSFSTAPENSPPYMSNPHAEEINNDPTNNPLESPIPDREEIGQEEEPEQHPEENEDDEDDIDPNWDEPLEAPVPDQEEIDPNRNLPLDDGTIQE